MHRKILLEVCCGSIEDALEAERGGADRIELNSCLMFGGLTPSIGTLKECKRKLNIPVIAMIRPREGGFCYSDYEVDVMEEDVNAVINSGADGIAFGILKADGTVDVERCRRIIDLAKNREVVFHRAFDVVPDPFKALDTLIGLGVKRVLTKGQENTLAEGYELVKQLINYGGERIEILPGGVKTYNVEDIVPKLKCNQVHVASFITRYDTSVSGKSHVFFGNLSKSMEDRFNLIDGDFVKIIRQKLDNIISTIKI